MAARGGDLRRYVRTNGRFLLFHLEQVWRSRSFGWSPALRQQVAEVTKEPAPSVAPPWRKTWSKEAVLEALASTVSRDPTACHYQFQDDPYLSPRTSSESKMYSLAEESGRSAAKYFVNNNPKFFTRDFAAPHIPCLMPESVSLLLEEVSEDALEERIRLRKVSAAVDMYDQLLQAGTAVSMETTHNLLDLICFYGDRDPLEDGEPQMEDAEEAADEPKNRKTTARPAADFVSWRENNNAERIFNLLPERDARCYGALIRGMVKHGANSKAFSVFTDMLNNRLTADVDTFSALISAAPHVREKFPERWDLITELLKQMNEQKVRPNLQTFNSVLKALRRCGNLAKSQSLHTLKEMKVLGIAPSLASYDHILAPFFRPGSGSSEILNAVLKELEGSSFTCRDPDDVLFFSSAMKVCLDNKDLDLGYKVWNLVDVGENWRLLGATYQQNFFYRRFFSLLCMMEHIDVVLSWYRRIVPSLYFPSSQGMQDLLQAVDADSRLDLLPTVWKEIKSLGHDNRPELLEELLGLMTRDQHRPEVQDSFADCALEVKKAMDGRPNVDWTPPSLSHITTLLLRAGRTGAAWEMLQLFKAKNRIPAQELMSDFLSACSADPQRAVQLVQLAASFCLPSTAALAARTLAEFSLTEEQRAVVSELEAAAGTSA